MDLGLPYTDILDGRKMFIKSSMPKFLKYFQVNYLPWKCIHSISVVAWVIFSPFIERETTYVTFCLRPCVTKPFRKGSALYGKNLLLEEQILSIKS